MTNAKVTQVDSGVYDISFDLGGNLNLVSGVDEVIQDITTNLFFIRGEWFIDLDSGIDYFGTVFVKSSSRAAIDEEFVRAIEDTTGVERIISYSSDIKRSTREFNITFNVATSLGNTGNIEVNVNV